MSNIRYRCPPVQPSKSNLNVTKAQCVYSAQGGLNCGSSIETWGENGQTPSPRPRNGPRKSGGKRKSGKRNRSGSKKAHKEHFDDIMISSEGFVDESVRGYEYTESDPYTVTENFFNGIVTPTNLAEWDAWRRSKFWTLSNGIMLKSTYRSSTFYFVIMIHDKMTTLPEECRHLLRNSVPGHMAESYQDLIRVCNQLFLDIKAQHSNSKSRLDDTTLLALAIQKQFSELQYTHGLSAYDVARLFVSSKRGN